MQLEELAPSCVRFDGALEELAPGCAPPPKPPTQWLPSSGNGALEELAPGCAPSPKPPQQRLPSTAGEELASTRAPLLKLLIAASACRSCRSISSSSCGMQTSRAKRSMSTSEKEGVQRTGQEYLVQPSMSRVP